MIVFVALLPAYILSIFYRSFLSVIANPVMADLGIGPGEFGFLGAAWFVTFALAQFPVGWALDRLGPRRTVATTMALGSVGAILFALATNGPMAMLGMALIGAGCSPVFMSALFLFARTEAPVRFAALTSAFIGLGSIGNLAGAGPLALAAERFGWRPAMLAMAVAFLLATVLAAALVRDVPKAKSDGADAQEGLLQGLRSIVALRQIWLLAPLTIVSYAIVVTVRGLWIAPYMREVHGFDAIAAGHVATAMAVAMVAGAFVFGAMERRFGRAKPLVLWGSVATGACFAWLALLGPGSHVAAITIFALIGVVGFTYAILMAHARIFFPEHLIGRGMTFVNFLFIGGAAAVQSGSGWLISAKRAAGEGPVATFATLHWGFAALMLAASAIYALTPERVEQRG